MKTSFMRDRVYPDLFGYRGRVTITIDEYAVAYGLTGTADENADTLANRVKASLSMIATTKESNRIVHRPFTFGANGALAASWKTDTNGQRTALVIELVAAPALYSIANNCGKIPTFIIRTATNNGKRKLHPLMAEAIDTANGSAPVDYFNRDISRLEEIGLA